MDAFVREGKTMIEEDACIAFVTSCGFVSPAPSSALIRTKVTDMS